MGKLDFNFVKSCFLKKGYTVLSKEYIKNNIPLIVEKDGYKAKISYSNFSMGKSPSFFKIDNEFLLDNIIELIKKKNNKLTLIKIEKITKNNRNRILCYLKCECGTEFKKTLDDVKSNKYCLCKKCYLKKRGFNHRKSKKEVLEKFKNVGYIILNKNEDFTRNDYIEVENEEGYRGFISYNRLLQNRKISIFDIRINEKNYIYNANVWSKLNGIGTEVLCFDDSKHFNTRSIRCRCQCGNEFVTSIISFQSGKNKCDACAKSNSKYERIVSTFLDEQNIKYIAEYRINSCRDTLPLPFDFYIDGKLIEIDGQGHYHPCHFNNINYENSKKTFDITKKHDEIKNNYCAKYNIPLLRIPYWDVENKSYKDKIIQFIKE